jgi:large subunit ribosomal protein L25
MGNKLYVTKVPTPNLKSCTQTTLLSVKWRFRAAMKAAQEAAKQQKHLQREKK